MDIIHLLPDNVANQIAAGEVVQRPSSVIKELLENSVDAGADKIDVWVTDAGKTSIIVSDNGKGMSETDARLAFERHATSKISDAADLYNLHTKGFRGEALASIAAVAHVELTTKTIDDEIGVHLALKDSKIIEYQPVACNRGAQFSVNNLFYNVPARRRFLKSNVTELKNIVQEFERVALIHHDIEFTLYKDGALIYDLRTGSFKKRICDMFGTSLDKSLLPVNVDTSLVKITGFVGVPESAKVKGARQFFFVNDRFMKHPYFHKAIQAAFERLISPEKQVSYFYCLEVDPSRIDVNVHPTKTEIKFEDEQSIWQILLAVTKEALGTFNAVPSLDFQPGASLDIPVLNPQATAVPVVKVDKSFNPFQKQVVASQNQRNWQELYSGLKKVDDNSAGLFASSHKAEQEPVTPIDEDSLDKDATEKYLQYGRFIFAPVRSGIMLIEKCNAHIRILYDLYMDNLSKKNGISQGLLFPELFQVSASQILILNKLTDELKSVGFDISDMGGGSYAVNGVPAGLEKRSPVDMILYFLDHYKENGITKETVNSYIALNLAKCNAITPSQKLSLQEMERLVSDLLKCNSPKYSPEGKVIMSILDENKLISIMK